MSFGKHDPVTRHSILPDPSQPSKETFDILAYRSILLDQVHDAIIGTDAHGVIQYWNPAAEKLLGWTAEEAIGKTTTEIFDAHLSEAERKQIHDKALSQEQISITGTRYHRSGQPLFIDITAKKIKGEGDQVIGFVMTVRDLTEKKQVEERNRQLNDELAQRNAELTIERERWQGVVEGIADEVWVCDLEGNTSLMNLKTVSPLGLEEFRDKPLDQVLEEIEILTPDGEVRQPKHSPLLHALHGEIVRGEEIMRHSVTGKTRYRQYSAAPTHNADGVVSGAVAIVRDITEYKEAEQALRESEERLQLATEAAQLGTWEWRPGDNYLVTNEIFHHINGQEPGSYQNNPLFGLLEMVHPEDRERMKDVILKTMQGAPVTGRPFRIIRPDGSVRWFHAFYKNITENGRLVRQIGAVMDITERINAEIALQKSADHFRVALSNASIAVFSADRELRYTWFYSAPMTGYSAHLIGKHDEEILPAEDVADFVALKRQAMQSRKEVRAEIILRLPSGPRNMIVSVEPLFDAHGEPDGVIGACQDVTDLRYLQAQQIEYATQVEVQRRLMDQREQDRQSIARDIHDGPIQTLSSTMFNLQYLNDAIENPALRVELEQIRLNVKNAVQELRDVINELRPPALLRFGLVRAIEQHVEDFRERRPEIELHLELTPDENVLDENSRLVLFRVYQESLVNIIRHAQASQVQVRLDINAAEIRLEITDNGQGFQVPTDFSGLTQNQHYGLAGMKERVETIGGSLEVESKPGVGTRITARVMRNFHIR
jgi:PAS domain S-box-containing protein